MSFYISKHERCNVIDYTKVLEPDILNAMADIARFFDDQFWFVSSGEIDYKSALELALGVHGDFLPDDKLKAMFVWLIAPDLGRLLKTASIPELTSSLNSHSWNRTQQVKDYTEYIIPELIVERDLVDWAVGLLSEFVDAVNGDSNLLEVHRDLLIGVWDQQLDIGAWGVDSSESMQLLSKVPIFTKPEHNSVLQLGTTKLGLVLKTVLGREGVDGLTIAGRTFFQRAIVEARGRDDGMFIYARRELAAAVVDCLELTSFRYDLVKELYSLLLKEGFGGELFWVLARRLKTANFVLQSIDNWKFARPKVFSRHLLEAIEKHGFVYGIGDDEDSVARDQFIDKLLGYAKNTKVGNRLKGYVDTIAAGKTEGRKRILVEHTRLLALLI